MNEKPLFASGVIMVTDKGYSESESQHKVLPLDKNYVYQKDLIIKVYRRRYAMLFLFSFLSFLCAMLFPQYVSMANLTTCYYDISITTLNWTVYVYYITYIVLVFPASLFMNRIGLRWTVIAGSLCNTTACALQFCGLTPSAFPYVLLSALFASMSNVLVLAVPPFLAAIWFPSKELSRACAAGVFGNQLGVAIGYVFSPLMVSSDCSNKSLIQSEKFNVATVLTSINLLWLILIVFVFQKAPKSPPSLAQMEKDSPKTHVKSIMSMVKNIHFVLLFIMYGTMVGTYFTVTVILNNLLLRYFPNKEVEIGWMGMLFIICGLVGSIISGFVLDYTHKFKETSLGICIASLITFIIFCSSLVLETLWVTFLTIGIFGFFLTGFLPVGLEYGIELTFPEPEVISASLLSASTCLLGMIVTEIVSRLLDNFGQLYSNIAVGMFLLISCIITIFISSEYKRCKKNLEGTNQNHSSIKNHS